MSECSLLKVLLYILQILKQLQTFQSVLETFVAQVLYNHFSFLLWILLSVFHNLREHFSCTTFLLFILAINERILILIAPKLFTSSIFIKVYILPKLERISSTWSVVTASTPQPKEFNCTNSKLSFLPTTSAALYSLEWNTHWSTTLIGLSTVDKCAILSSDKIQTTSVNLYYDYP